MSPEKGSPATLLETSFGQLWRLCRWRPSRYFPEREEEVGGGNWCGHKASDSLTEGKGKPGRKEGKKETLVAREKIRA